MIDSLPPEKREPIIAAIRDERRIIEAIKLLREATGCGLAEAKNAVDQYRARLQGEATASSPTAFDFMSPAKRQEILQAVRSGQKIEAIKLVRDLTGCGLKEAKDFVESIESGNKPASPGKPAAMQGKGCSAVLAMAAVFVLLVCVTVAFFWKS
jgi:ribosomal protein L7/L12